MDLLDEIRSDQDSRGSRGCSVCEWVSQRGSDRAKWETAMADESFQSAAILRAAQKRGAEFKSSTISRHRKEHVKNDT